MSKVTDILSKSELFRELDEEQQSRMRTAAIAQSASPVTEPTTAAPDRSRS